ncbi:hypothetical protein Tco_0012478 [Tanacetum coccineum]
METVVEKGKAELEKFETMDENSVEMESKRHKVVVFTMAPSREFCEPFMRLFTPYGVDGHGAWDVELNMAYGDNYITEEWLGKLGFVRVDYGDYGRKLVRDG